MTKVELTDRERKLYEELVDARALLSRMLDGDADGYDASSGIDSITRVLTSIRGCEVDWGGDPV